MPVAMISEVPQATFDMYRTVMERLGGRLAKGHLLHVVGEREGGGLRVFDVWESLEDFERFNREQLWPVVREVTGGRIDPPRRLVYEVRDLVTAI